MTRANKDELEEMLKSIVNKAYDEDNYERLCYDAQKLIDDAADLVNVKRQYLIDTNVIFSFDCDDMEKLQATEEEVYDDSNWSVCFKGKKVNFSNFDWS